MLAPLLAVNQRMVAGGIHFPCYSPVFAIIHQPSIMVKLDNWPLAPIGKFLMFNQYQTYSEILVPVSNEFDSW